MTTDSLADILAGDELHVGLAVGFLALAAVLLVARRGSTVGRRDPAPLVGLFVALGGAATIAATSWLPGGVAVGLVLLAGAGHVAGGSCRRGLLLGLPGSAFVAAAGPSEPSWVPAAVLITATVGSVAVASFDRRYASLGLGPVLFAVSVVGVFVTVPDTRAALALVGVAVPLALAGWPRARARLGDAGAFASVGLLCWVVADGGITRSGAVIGGLACLGLLAVEPASRTLLASRAAERLPTKSVALALHVVVVMLVARVAGLRASTLAALLIASTVLMGAVTVMAWLIRSERPL